MPAPPPKHPAPTAEMSETRIAATNRWQREGRRAETTLYREDATRRHREQIGVSKAQATDLAWEDTLVRFPALTPAEMAAAKAGLPASDPETDPLDISKQPASRLKRLAAIPPDLDRDMLWVYAHLELPDIQLEAAPSLGAWSLLRVARADPAKFMDRVFTRIKPAAPTPEAKPSTEPKEPRKRDEGLQELRGMVDG